MLPHQTRAWARLSELAAAAAPRIEALFAAEPGRLSALCVEAEGILFDFSKLPVTAAECRALAALADAAGFPLWRDRLAGGAVVNRSEGRAATHMALRDPRHRAGAMEICRMAELVRAGGFGNIRHVLHIGIGGSALGPALLLDALGAAGDGPEVRVVQNVDGVALERALAGCRAAETLVVVASKSFTTEETVVNLDSALRWLEAEGGGDPLGRVVAVTAAPALARARGIRHVLRFPESVGGRYSLWSAVGLSFAIRCGGPAFLDLLAGAHAMDRHFLEAPDDRNAPLLAAMFDVWLASFRDYPTRAVFAYDERLRLLPGYLQQLEMESNGKGTARDGSPLPCRTAPVVWGGTGTDAQHAVFQLLHQGTQAVAIEFVAVRAPGHRLDGRHHRLLLANCLAQGAALLHGDPVARGVHGFPGNRGSSTILVDRLTPGRLGALLAFYEARTFAAGVLTGVNSFDQWGVELGKMVAGRMMRCDLGDLDPSTRLLVETAFPQEGEGGL